ncbi:DUF4494 domain-containing protein [Porphyromonas levii]|uniref:DUF4494 domain-containing protein n=1 Tax=Porphyromonas levii TaxID=28114 RepID=UPI001B8A9F9E|nr:DUF4494 domain-containing protein [Porphyromonas levii]MBR8759260.1 hypothetical protein [Porphyromonas levii]
MSWFICKITYEKEVNQAGKMRKVSEEYLVDAETFTDAEERMYKEMNSRGAFIIDSVRKVRFYELFLDEQSERYYRCKVGFVTLDERLGVERKKYVQMMVQADSLEVAIEKLHDGMHDTLSDYELASVTETNIMDVFKYQIESNGSQS